MKKIFAILITFVLLLSICSCSSVEYMWYNKEKAPTDVYSVTYDNGDSFYIPDGNHVAFDDDCAVLYYDNMLIAFTDGELSAADTEIVAGSINGEVVGVVRGGINSFQILLDACNLSELVNLSESLMKNENVIYACPEYPVQIMSEYEEEYIEEEYTDLWWQDVISLDVAWNYSESCCNINVGIVDTGFYTEHDEFKDKITLVGDNNSNYDNHGNHCLGIMAAENDNKGIRGIADNAHFFCADVWHDADNEDSYHTMGELMAAYNYMAENDVRVINNSWGCYIFDKDYYKKLSFGNSMKYDDWLNKRINADLLPTAEAMIVMICQLIDAGYEELIFVQSAGNGCYPSGTPVDTSTGGYFCSIDENIFNNLPPSASAYLDKNEITYDDIDDRTIIVGASCEYVNDNGDFLPASFSNYGDNIDIFAPGENIYSCVSPDAGSYQYMSGTSMAAPMVTGAVAFLWSLDTDMTAGEVKELILGSTLNKVCFNIDNTQYEYTLLDIGFAAETLMNTN